MIYSIVHAPENGLLSISGILCQIEVKGHDIGWYRVKGVMTVAFVQTISAIVERLILAETDKVLPTPSLPTEFQQTLVEQPLKRDGLCGHSCTTANGIVVGLRLSVVAQSEVGLCPHEQHIGKAEEHDVVVHQFAVLYRILVHLVFLHSRTCRLHVWTATEIERNLARFIDEGLPRAVGDSSAIEVGDGTGPIAEGHNRRCRVCAV